MTGVFRRRTILAGFGALFLAVIVGAVMYARSERAARLVGAKLEARLGMPVRVGSLDLGAAHTTAHELQVFERDASVEAAAPWVTAKHVELDVSAVSAALGRSPSLITLSDAHVTLRFNKDGDLITKLPVSAGDGGGPLPNIRLISGELTLRQDGRPDAVFNGIDLNVCLECGNPTVRGTVRDEAWGTWNVEGLIDTPTQVATMTLKTAAPTAVTPELLSRTPFVNPNAWQAVRLRGTTGAALDMRLDLASEKFTYRMAMTPAATEVDVPSVGLNFHDASGAIVAEGATLTLSGVEGKTAGGTVKLDSKMDFGGNKDVLNFTAHLADVDVTKLPEKWSIPEGIEGRLRAKVNFTVTLLPTGGVTTDGRGEGVVEQAKFRGLPVDPVRITVRPSRRGGFELSRADAPADGVFGLAMFQVPERAAPVQKAEPAAKKKGDPDETKVGIMTQLLRGIAKVVKPADAPKEERAYLTINLSLTDVNVADVLKSLKATLPIRLEGKVTVKLRADIPTEAPGEFAAYRLAGTVSAKRITVEDLALEQITMRLNVRDGKLTIQELTGRFPGRDADAPVGLFTAKGEMTLGKTYPFSAAVKLDKIALERMDDLRDVVPIGVPLDGMAEAEGTAEGTLQPVSVKTKGVAQANKVKVGPFAVTSFSTKWESDDGAIRFKDIFSKMYKGEVTGDFTVPFRTDVDAGGKLKLFKIDLGEISKSLPIPGNVALEGTAGGTLVVRVPPADATGSRPITAEVELKAPTMKLQGFPAEKIKVNARFNAGIAKYKVTGDALGGQFEIAGQYPPPPSAKTGAIVPLLPLPKKAVPDVKPAVEGKKPAPIREEDLTYGMIRLLGVKLSKVTTGAGLQNTLGLLDADIDGLFPLETDAEKRLVGAGRVRATRIRWGDKSVALLGEGTMRLTPTEMRLEDFEVPLENGLARITAILDRTNVDRSRAVVHLSNVPSDTLFFVFPTVAKWVKTSVSGTVSTTLGREWRGSGVLIAKGGTVYKIPIQEARLPIDWVAYPKTQRAEIHLRDMVGTAARGRVTGKAEVTFFPELDDRLSGELKFGNVDVSTIFASAKGVIGSTPVSGTFTFGSERLRTADDLTARLEAKSGEATPFGLPVLAQATPLLGYASGANPSISQGDIKASLAKGVWTVQRVALTGASLDIFAEGTVTTDGRLNLNVAGSTGKLDLGAGVLSRLTALATQFARQPLNPGSLQQAVGILGNFVVYLEVTGTVDTPQYKIQTIRTLREDAIRFFLLRYVPVR